MAKKERNSGLGRGLDSLIPNIEEKEVEEGISLEDLLKKSEKEEEKIEEKQFEEEPVDEDKELVFTEEDFKTDDDILVEESDVEKYEKRLYDRKLCGSSIKGCGVHVIYRQREKKHNDRHSERDNV